MLDERGEVVLEQKLGTTPKAMKEGFGGIPRSRIALETGMHSPWVSRLLSELGHEVVVAHARNVRLIGESRKKDDHSRNTRCASRYWVQNNPVECKHSQDHSAFLFGHGFASFAFH